MGLKFSDEENYLIISLDGKLDSLNAREINEKIEEQLKHSNKDVIFDVEHLEYMTSAGLQVLLMASKNRNAKNKKTFIYKPQKIVDYVIKISGFYAFLQKIDKIAGRN